jgi:hypothetical protein
MNRIPFLDRDLKTPLSDSETRPRWVRRVDRIGRVAWALTGILVAAALFLLFLSALERNDYPLPRGYPIWGSEETRLGDQEHPLRDQGSLNR